LNVEAGAEILDVIRNAVTSAREFGEDVTFQFGDTVYTVSPTDSFETARVRVLSTWPDEAREAVRIAHRSRTASPHEPKKPNVIRALGIWLAVGDIATDDHEIPNVPNGSYPLFFCENGDGNASGYVAIGSIQKDGYEVACDAAMAYNEQRNTERDAEDKKAD
jgi:hypothetical protein